jgi:hypothetical protein
LRGIVLSLCVGIRHDKLPPNHLGMDPAKDVVNMFVVRSVMYLTVLLLVLSSSSLPAQFTPAIATSSPGMVTLGWKPSPSAGVSGYYLCWGLASGQTTNRLDAGSVTNVSLTSLATGPTYYFTVVAYSSFGDEAPPSNEVSYSVPAPVNQRPTLNPISDVLLQENNAPVAVALTGIGTGSASETQTLLVTAFSGNTSVIPNPTVSYTSPNSTGSLSLQPLAGVSGSAIITVMVDDGQATNNTVIQTFIVDVQPANRPPTIDPIGNLTIPENSGIQTVTLTGISPGSTNEIQPVTLSATSSKPALINPVVKLAAPATSGSLTFTPASGASGTATISVVVDDGQPTNSITTRSFDVTVVHNVPTQTPLTNVTIAPYSTFKYVLTSPFPNSNPVDFVLDTGAPQGAKVSTRRKVTALSWTPSSAYASTTNLLSVKATDSTNPNLTTNLLFVVNVIDYLTVNPGMVAVQTGNDVALPLGLVSSDPLSNVTFTVSWPSARFSNPSLTLASGSIFTSSLQVQGTNLQVNLRAAAGKSFIGSNFVANLNFTIVTNQLSAFVPMSTTVLAGTKPNNGSFLGLFPGLGEVAVVADQPLLRAVASTNSPRSLNLYGQVGATYQVLFTTNVTASPAWQPLTTYTHTNVAQSLTVGGSDPMIFYRLKKQ